MVVILSACAAGPITPESPFSTNRMSHRPSKSQEKPWESENVAENNLASTAKFLRTCLAVNTANTSRATALEVLEGGWITSGCACQCGWCDF